MIGMRASIVGNQVDQAWQQQAVGARTFNPDLMMCPLWTGVDLAGRPVCKDSFYTKRAGCNSALDRIKIEDSLRPRYAEFLWDARGIEGVGADYPDNSSSVNMISDQMITDRRLFAAANSGQFGNVTPAQQIGGSYFRADLCASNAYENCPTLNADMMALASESRRNAQNLAQGYGPSSFKPAGSCNPNTTVCRGIWDNDMASPRNPSYNGNYVQLQDVNHRSGQRI
jgi:hypothetical protein